MYSVLLRRKPIICSGNNTPGITALAHTLSNITTISFEWDMESGPYSRFRQTGGGYIIQQILYGAKERKDTVWNLWWTPPGESWCHWDSATLSENYRPMKKKSCITGTPETTEYKGHRHPRLPTINWVLPVKLLIWTNRNLSWHENGTSVIKTEQKWRPQGSHMSTATVPLSYPEGWYRPHTSS